MRRRGTAAVSSFAPVVALVLASVTASPTALADAAEGDLAATASDEPAAAPAQHIGYGAMPGGLHVATAETLPPGTLELAVLSGFGYRKGLLSADHSFDRASGDLAVAYAPVANLVLGVSLDGRYDKHKGPAMSTDDNYVGDPHVLARFAAPVGRLSLGGQLGIWVPGKDAPSIAASAISVDARGLATIEAGFGTVTAMAGFRLDNSAKSVDNPGALSVADRVSLGVSDFHAALAGISLRIPAGSRAYVELEGSADVFVGSGAPSPIVRGGGLVGVALGEEVSIVGYVEAAKVPGLSYSQVTEGHVVLVPYEPSVTGGVGLQARFGGPRRVAATSQVTRNDRAVPVPVPVTADVSGVVLDDVGKPVVGARITVKLKNTTGNTITDERGEYTIAKLPIGKTVDGKTDLDDTGAEISAEVADKKPGVASLTLTRGHNAVPQIALDPMLPPGQLRAVIINVGTSRPVNGATVEIEPGGLTATSGPDGKFTINLPPGHYKLTVTARGLAQQQLDVNIEQNGVAIKNIELHK